MKTYLLVHKLEEIVRVVFEDKKVVFTSDFVDFPSAFLACNRTGGVTCRRDCVDELQQKNFLIFSYIDVQLPF